MPRKYTMSIAARRQRREAGKALYEKYGSEYMSMIGKRGYEQFRRLYVLVPFNAGDFAIKRKSDGEIVALLSGEYPGGNLQKRNGDYISNPMVKGDNK